MLGQNCGQSTKKIREIILCFKFPNMNLHRKMNFKEKGSLTTHISSAKMCRWRRPPTKWGVVAPRECSSFGCPVFCSLCFALTETLFHFPDLLPSSSSVSLWLSLFVLLPAIPLYFLFLFSSEAPPSGLFLFPFYPPPEWLNPPKTWYQRPSANLISPHFLDHPIIFNFQLWQMRAKWSDQTE